MGMNLPYEDLCEMIPQLTHYSSSPVEADDLNPLIKGLLDTCTGSSIYGLGGHSVLISIEDRIAAKVATQKGGKHLQREQAVFESLGQTACPHLIRPFLQCPDVIFLPLIPNGSLYERMEQQPDKSRPVCAWMRQLAKAAASLEGVGYAHGDINPGNILYDHQDRLHLVDLDHACLIGEDLNVGYEPYVRGRRYPEPGGDYGVAGPVTDQFALGSIFWYITRGYELYSDMSGLDRVMWLEERKFPTVDPNNPIDRIIDGCWRGRFKSLADLFHQISEMTGPHSDQDSMSEDHADGERKSRCREIYHLLTQINSQSSDSERGSL